MRKRIHGLNYDTDKAKEIFTWNSSNSFDDLEDYQESLFKKRTGEYFIYGKNQIVPIKADEAKAILLQHVDKSLKARKIYDIEFGKIISSPNEQKEIKSYSLKKSTIAKIKRIASENGINQSEVIDRLFEDK